MSIGKLSDAGHLGEQFKDMTLEQFKDHIKKTFYQAYGRYENASGKMYVEIEHNGAVDNHEAGSVKWRKGETGNPELIEDLVLEREQAIPKFFMEVVEKGYSIVFSAITPDDFTKGHEKQELAKSAMAREGLLGIYVRGKEFFRVNEYEGNYSVERGYDSMITKGKHQLTESEARLEIDLALAEGFRREGEEEEIECVNPFAAWGVTNDEAAETNVELQNKPPKEGEFNINGFAAMFGED